MTQGSTRMSEIATLAGGCFWCLEAVYDQLKGVEHVESGYTGGQVINPSYRQICNGDTGHAEAVQITYDPQLVSFKDLLDIFFTIHDPTSLNRQGADVGTQYRSAIFYRTPQQNETAERTIADLNAAKIWAGPFVPQVAPLETYSRGEDSHQEYFRTNPGQPYCQAVV